MPSACSRHPDRDAAYYCQKDDRYLCRECARCYNPRIYCTFRTACVIDLLTKEGELPRVEQDAEMQDSSS